MSELSFLGCLYKLIIVGLLITISIAAYFNILSKQQAMVALEQLENAIHYAQSLAISQNRIIYICPSIDKKNCSFTNTWQDGYLILNSNRPIKYFSGIKHGILVLHCFGNNQLALTIQPNGSTYNNGHFNYISSKFLQNTNFALYFNKGLRTYIVQGNS